MLLVIDVGNTSIHFGVFKNQTLVSSFRVETKRDQTSDEYGIKILDQLRYQNCDASCISKVIIGSVVPELNSTLAKTIKQYLNSEALFVGPGVKTGLNIKVEPPQQLGADLLSGAVGAVQKYGAPVIIIDMGTATTFSVVNANGEFLGGIIYPGLYTSFKTLVSQTSLLKAAPLDLPKNVIGNDTNSSLQSGMVYGTVSMIEGLLQRLHDEIGPAPVVVTGGVSEVIKNELRDVIFDDTLVLDGLALIARKNFK